MKPGKPDESDTSAGFVLAGTGHGLFSCPIARATVRRTGFLFVQIARRALCESGRLFRKAARKTGGYV